METQLLKSIDFTHVQDISRAIAFKLASDGLISVIRFLPMVIIAQERLDTYFQRNIFGKKEGEP
jgi:hypothetical protein